MMKALEVYLRRWMPDAFRRVIRWGFERLWTLGHLTERSRWMTELATILSDYEESDRVVLFLPSVVWDFILFQRPHHLAREMARQGWLVFYLELPFRNPQRAGFEKIEENLYIARVPVGTFKEIVRPWVYTLPYNTGYLRDLTRPRILYDYVDELEVFRPYPLRRLRRAHQWLLEHAVVVLATAHRLVERVQVVRPDVMYVPNGVDYEQFKKARDRVHSAPPDLQPIIGRGPVAGYYGALAEWFDYKLFADVATRLSDWSFVLIGPEHDRSFVQSGLHSVPNIFYLGPKPYRQLPDYLRWMDVMVIPFRLNAITHATSPLKLFEYMAALKPVVITPMEESMSVPGVLVADTVDSFVERLREAYRIKDDPMYIARLDETARKYAWSVIAQKILQRMEGIRDEKGHLAKD